MEPVRGAKAPHPNQLNPKGTLLTAGRLFLSSSGFFFEKDASLPDAVCFLIFLLIFRFIFR